jgi:hypothetical protein
MAVPETMVTSAWTPSFGDGSGILISSHPGVGLGFEQTCLVHGD